MKNYPVYLRPLVIEDARISYRWRNNPKIWLYTKFRSQKHITLGMEVEWLANNLKKKDECRFAICLKETDEYIGNIQIIDIHNRTGEFHLFIGEEKYWGKGISTKASRLLFEYAFLELQLEVLVLDVHVENQAAISLYRKLGFSSLNADQEFIRMMVTRDIYCRSLNSLSQ